MLPVGKSNQIDPAALVHKNSLCPRSINLTSTLSESSSSQANNFVNQPINHDIDGYLHGMQQSDSLCLPVQKNDQAVLQDLTNFTSNRGNTKHISPTPVRPTGFHPVEQTLSPDIYESPIDTRYQHQGRSEFGRQLLDNQVESPLVAAVNASLGTYDSTTIDINMSNSTSDTNCHQVSSTWSECNKSKVLEEKVKSLEAEVKQLKESSSRQGMIKIVSTFYAAIIVITGVTWS